MHTTSNDAPSDTTTSEHAHDLSGADCCAHHEVPLTDKRLLAYLFGGVLIATSKIIEWTGFASPQIAELPAMLGALLLSFELIMAAFTELKRGRPSTSCLAALAVIAAMATGEYAAAGLLAFILLVFGQLVRRAAFGAQRAIEDLIELTPDTARVVENGEAKEVSLDRVQVGMTVRVRPGENLPVDGQVVAGTSTINQASLTGEAVPVEVQAGDSVYAGTTNLTGGLDLEVTQVGAETTIGKVTQLIAEAETSRTPRQTLIEQVARFFVPVALSVALVVWYLKSNSEDPTQQAQAALAAVTVLVVSCPAAMLLAAPSALVAAFAAAARLGILVKNTNQLEQAAQIDAVVLDKTGTITTGKFAVAKLAPAEGVEGAELLRAAANGEQHSNHPLAQSILDTARKARIDPDHSDDYEEIHGRGVRARTSLGEICVGRSSWLAELNPAVAAQLQGVESKIEGMSGVHVMLDGRYLGAVGLEDTVRRGVKGVVGRLRDLGMRSVAIFTGDRFSVAKRVGVAIGADAIEAECLPEEKHEQVRALVAEGYRVMMVGDGINDGPSLAAADVGVAMGLAGSDIAANSAGVALMTDELNRIPFLIELARKTRTIITQNIAISIVVAIVGLVATSLGWLADMVWLAALYHFIGEVLVLFNSFRLFRFGEEYAHAEEAQEVQRRTASIRGLSAKPA